MPHSRPHVEAALRFSRRQVLTLAAAIPVAAAIPASADEPTAAQRMSEPGPEENKLRGWTGRWDVVAMPAWSFGPPHEGKITVEFNPQGFVGFGKDVEGRFMVSDMVISQPAPDRTLKEQHVTMADGTGRTWQFVRYDYKRKP